MKTKEIRIKQKKQKTEPKEKHEKHIDAEAYTCLHTGIPWGRKTEGHIIDTKNL